MFSGINNMITSLGGGAMGTAKLLITIIGGVITLVLIIMALVHLLSKKKRKDAIGYFLAAVLAAAVTVGGFAVANALGSSAGSDIQKAIPAGTLQ